jgi:hypothetical protein
MGLFEQQAFLRQIPVVQNMAHDEDIGRRERVREEISRQKFYPAGYTTLGYEFLEDWLHLGQIISSARKMRMRSGKSGRHHALRGANVGKGFIILPREFGGDRLRRAEAHAVMAARNPRNLSGSA